MGFLQAAIRAVTIFTLLDNAFAVTCGGNRPLTMCCMGLAPYYTNSGIWGGTCGYHPTNTSELIGGRCIIIATGATCPYGSISTCCAGSVPGQCALGTDCGDPVLPPATPLPPAIPAPIPTDWSTASSCAADSASRIIENDVVRVLADNTPEICVSHCAAAGYAVAGVENGDECHCGTGLVSSAPHDVDAATCSARCVGDNRYTCGGPWAIQVYTGPEPVPIFPAGWSVDEACAVDTASRVIADDVVTNLDNNTPGACMEFCQDSGYTVAGVEYGGECHCGTGYVGGSSPDAAPTSECNVSCSGNPSLTCGGGWRLQLYSYSAA